MDDERDDLERVTSWAGGGSWSNDEPPPTPPPPPPKKKAKPKPDVGLFPRFRPKATRGLVAGRFDPLHRGHEHVVELARQSVEELAVVVFASKKDAIPGRVRAQWIRESVPWAVNVYEVDAQETPSDFKSAVLAATGRTDYDVFFSSELEAGAAAAQAIGATFVPVDPEREAIPTSGTLIRADVMTRFDDLSLATRPFFVRRVAVVGAESTGKTTLCKRLAEIYSTVFVPEPARSLASVRDGKLDPAALELWSRTQMAAEDSLARHARRVLFADTDPDTVVKWSMRLYGQIHPGIEETTKRLYDLTLICEADVPFVGVPERDEPEERAALARELRNASGLRRIVLTGTWEQRLLAARKAVDQVLAKKTFLSERGAQMIASG